MRNLFAILILALNPLALTIIAQQPSALKSLPGEVIMVDSTNNQLKLQSANGEITVLLTAKTEFKRVSPDKPSDLSLATQSNISEISAGDKVVVVGVLSEDKKTFSQTKRVFLLTKADIAKKQEADTARWTTRGVAGKIIALDNAANTVTIALRNNFGGGVQPRTMLVTTSGKTIFHRYAANSVKFSDASISNFSELKIGDQLRAAGEKNSDSTAITADEILFGSFRMVAGKITALNAAKGEIIIKDLQTNKDVTVVVNSDTLLRRFPAEMAQRITQMQAMRAAAGGMPPGMNGAAGGAGQRQNNGQTQPNGMSSAERLPPGNAATGGMGSGQGGGGRGGRGGDMDSMLEQMPVLALTELKVGDAVAASSSVGANPNQVTAIKFVAGIEPFLNTPQPTGMPQGNRPQSSPAINIPGLDGIGAP